MTDEMELKTTAEDDYETWKNDLICVECDRVIKPRKNSDELKNKRTCPRCGSDEFLIIPKGEAMPVIAQRCSGCTVSEKTYEEAESFAERVEEQHGETVGEAGLRSMKSIQACNKHDAAFMQMTDRVVR